MPKRKFCCHFVCTVFFLIQLFQNVHMKNESMNFQHFNNHRGSKENWLCWASSFTTRTILWYYKSLLETRTDRPININIKTCKLLDAGFLHSNLHWLIFLCHMDAGNIAASAPSGPLKSSCTKFQIFHYIKDWRGPPKLWWVWDRCVYDCVGLWGASGARTDTQVDIERI